MKRIWIVNHFDGAETTPDSFWTSEEKAKARKRELEHLWRGSPLMASPTIEDYAVDTPDKWADD